MKDVRRDAKECSESIKADLKNVSSDIKGMVVVTESMKEGMKDIKKDIKEVVKEGVKEAVNEMKNIERPEMKADYRISMENIEKDGELYLVGFLLCCITYGIFSVI